MVGNHSHMFQKSMFVSHTYRAEPVQKIVSEISRIRNKIILKEIIQARSSE